MIKTSVNWTGRFKQPDQSEQGCGPEIVGSCFSLRVMNKITPNRLQWSTSSVHVHLHRLCILHPTSYFKYGLQLTNCQDSICQEIRKKKILHTSCQNARENRTSTYLRSRLIGKHFLFTCCVRFAIIWARHVHRTLLNSSLTIDRKAVHQRNFINGMDEICSDLVVNERSAWIDVRYDPQFWFPVTLISSTFQ